MTIFVDEAQPLLSPPVSVMKAKTNSRTQAQLDPLTPVLGDT